MPNLVDKLSNLPSDLCPRLALQLTRPGLLPRSNRRHRHAHSESFRRGHTEREPIRLHCLGLARRSHRLRTLRVHLRLVQPILLVREDRPLGRRLHSIRVDGRGRKVGLVGLDLVASLEDADAHHGEQVVRLVRVVVHAAEKGGRRVGADGSLDQVGASGVWKR